MDVNFSLVNQTRPDFYLADLILELVFFLLSVYAYSLVKLIIADISQCFSYNLKSARLNAFVFTGSNAQKLHIST